MSKESAIENLNFEDSLVAMPTTLIFGRSIIELNSSFENSTHPIKNIFIFDKIP